MILSCSSLLTGNILQLLDSISLGQLLFYLLGYCLTDVEASTITTNGHYGLFLIGNLVSNHQTLAMSHNTDLGCIYCLDSYFRVLFAVLH